MNSEQAPRTAVGRFAPSPSGRMHLGNVFCALLSWLSARHDGGRWLLRIEDLDTQRCRREYADALEDDLHWLGLDWDEGGSTGGEHGPYYQSLRTDIYRRFFERLEAAGLTYPCFCSRADLKASQAPHASDHAPVYAGTCRHLMPAERERLAAVRRPSVRLALPDAESRFDDGHYGPLDFRELVKDLASVFKTRIAPRSAICRPTAATLCCAAPTACSPISLQWWWTMR